MRLSWNKRVFVNIVFQFLQRMWIVQMNTHSLALSLSPTNKNRMDSGLDTELTTHNLQIISSLLNTSYNVVIKNTDVWAMALLCMQ